MKNALLMFIFFGISCLLTGQTVSHEGFFDFEYNEKDGKVLVDVGNVGEEFIYVNYLSAGLGSNDVGLDRGQIGDTRLVKFERFGNKLMLIHKNTKYRAVSDNEKEVRAVKEAFAESVLFGFKIEKEEDSKLTIDLTPFLIRDAHGVAKRLKSREQGVYKLDKGKSVVNPENTMSFPDNSEFEALVTFVGEAKGNHVRSVTPTSDIVSVRMHHSFVRLPDDGYKKRAYHPYSGFFNISYADYASPIHAPIEKKFIERHRLEKKDPSAAVSEAVEPIVYYIDPGCPEPIKSALIEGGSWWNQAFEAAGYKDAFRIEELPDGASMMDVRYNVIQWVHRSTRGWSYGSSVTDPRTGEIIKGHVSLGSLRVRQDFMIAQGILSPYANDDENHGAMEALALARLRQLSAHEIGHTIGLAHNFAASVNGRASVMDYPHPIISLIGERIDLSDAYDDKIGAWDKRAIIYGYQDFEDGADQDALLKEIIAETQKMELLFLSDPDARPAGSLSPQAHLWDNGKDPVEELNRLVELRKDALSRFGENTITSGTPYSELEKILVPVYLMHRYQVEAACKNIGGVDYNYKVKGDGQELKNEGLSADEQNKTIEALLTTLTPDFLKLPASVKSLIPPSAYGYNRSRESFKGNTGLGFDVVAAAESSANHVLSLMLNKQRLSRLNNSGPGPNELPFYLDKIVDHIFNMPPKENDDLQIHMMLEKLAFYHLIKLSQDNDQIAAVANHTLNEIMRKKLVANTRENLSYFAHAKFLRQLREKEITHPGTFKLPEIAKMPPGSPIGCGGMH